MIDHDGNDTTLPPDIETPKTLPHNTMFLLRCPKGAGDKCNRLDNEEMWNVVQSGQNIKECERGAIPFVDPNSDMEMRAYKIQDGTSEIRELLGEIATVVEYRSEVGGRREKWGTDLQAWMRQRKDVWRKHRVEQKFISLMVERGVEIGGLEGGHVESSKMTDRGQVAYVLHDIIGGMQAKQDREDDRRMEAEAEQAAKNAAREAAEKVVEILEAGRGGVKATGERRKWEYGEEEGEQNAPHTPCEQR